MEHFDDAPQGATGTGMPRNGGDMSNIAHQSGWRKATAGLATAEQLAHAGEQAAVPKTQAFVALKRVGAHIGLKAGDILLLDTLGAFTQAQDWEEGRRPIVWASNAYLMEQTGFSLSALKRHARRLAEAGVISFKDSPNGKRWGTRDKRGVIVAAYGIDLSPLRARQAAPTDFTHFDHVYAMDRSNFADLTTIRPSNASASLDLFLGDAEVPDPYYGGTDGFDYVLDLITARMETLFEELTAS